MTRNVIGVWLDISHKVLLRKESFINVFVGLDACLSTAEDEAVRRRTAVKQQADGAVKQGAAMCSDMPGNLVIKCEEMTVEWQNIHLPV